jgi:hypothetical protein
MHVARRLLNEARESRCASRLDDTAWRESRSEIRRSPVKKFFAVCFLGLMSAGIAACAVSTEPADEEGKAESLGLESQTIIGPCPYEWTCNSITFYTTKPACVAACGTKPCQYDEYNNGHCIPR